MNTETKKSAGRHPLPEGVAKSSTTFRLPPDLKAWLIEEAGRTGISQANIVKNALLMHQNALMRHIIPK
jgi:hypothetical protein